MAADGETFRDHLLSVYQSAVDDVAGRLDDRSQDRSRGGRGGLRRSARSVLPAQAAEVARREYAAARGLVAPDAAGPADRALAPAGVAKVCADLAYRYLKARVTGDAASLEAVRSEFKAGTCDPAWASTMEEYVRYFGPGGTRGTVPYVRAADVGPRTIEVKSDARIALFSDWATGGEPAMAVLRALAARDPDVLVHLGDVYYSGTPSECGSNFVDPIEALVRGARPDVPVYALSGNHDMYCGGVGYYQMIGGLNRGAAAQGASFFCLRAADESWQLLAMDTGLHDHDPLGVNAAVTRLEEDELEWHCARMGEFRGRTILLSHHPLFSAYSSINRPGPGGKRSPTNPHLLAAFQALAGRGRVAAWFWGHEHAFTLYRPFSGLERGRCIGHGGVPVSVLDRADAPLPDLDVVPSVVDGLGLAADGGVHAHGFAMLSLDGERCSAEYVQVAAGRASTLYVEAIT